jgi:hypothetical protein
MAAVLQHLPRVVRRLVNVVVNDVSHDADECEIDRLAQRLLHRRSLRIVFALEIRERVRAGSGEERLAGACGVAPLHGGFERRFEAAIRRRQQEIDRPAREMIAAVDFDRAQLLRRQRRILLVERRDDVEVCDERAQLGSRAELELRAFVRVEGLRRIIRLHAHVIRVLAALEQREGVEHGGGSAAPSRRSCTRLADLT